MKNKTGLLPPSVNLKYPLIFGASFLIVSVVSLLLFGNLYAYYWYIMPQRYISLAGFAVLFVLMQMYAGLLCGFLKNYTNCKSARDRLLAMAILCLTAFLSLLWCGALFSAMSPLTALILSIMMIACSVFFIFFTFRYMLLSSLLSLLLVFWYMNLLRLSLSILILN